MFYFTQKARVVKRRRKKWRIELNKETKGDELREE